MNPKSEVELACPPVKESDDELKSELVASEALQDAIVIYGWYWLLMEELELMGKRLG